MHKFFLDKVGCPLIRIIIQKYKKLLGEKKAKRKHRLQEEEVKKILNQTARYNSLSRKFARYYKYGTKVRTVIF